VPLLLIFARIGRAALAGVLACAVLAQPAAADLARAQGTAGDAAERQAFDALEPRRAVRIRQLIADPEGACLPATAVTTAGRGAPAAERSRAAAALAAAAGALRASPVGAWLLDQAAARSVLICLDPATPLAAYYYARPRLIGVQASLPPAARTLYLAHELAHVPQHPRYSNDRRFPVEDLLLMHRLREATAEAIATRTLWQMRERGQGEPWRAKLATGYGDIARAFAAVMAGAADRRGALRDELELRATRAAFDQWFAAPLRLQQYDSHLLDHVERIAQDRLGLIPPQRRLSEPFLAGIAWYAGASFLSAAGTRPLTGAHYRAGLSSDAAARLAQVLRARAGDLAGEAAAAAADAAAPRP
jgi:hypothetical protein